MALIELNDSDYKNEFPPLPQPKDWVIHPPTLTIEGNVLSAGMLILFPEELDVILSKAKTTPLPHLCESAWYICGQQTFNTHEVEPFHHHLESIELWSWVNLEENIDSAKCNTLGILMVDQEIKLFELSKLSITSIKVKKEADYFNRVTFYDIPLVELISKLKK